MHQSSTVGSIPPSSPATFAILRIPSPSRIGGDSRPISRARFLPSLAVVDLLRSVSLSPPLFLHPPAPQFSPLPSCSSPLPRLQFSLAHSSGRGWSCLCCDFRLFFLLAPHLPPSLLPPPPPPSPPPQRSSSFGVRTLFVVSPLLFILLQPIRFIIVLCLLKAHILSNIHAHRNTLHASLSRRLSSVILLHPFSTLLASFYLCLS